jgi:Flp pilus assembly protein TadG
MSPITRNNGRTARRAEIRRPQSGQALLELALMLPFLLLLVVGVVEIGRYAYIGVLVANAAHAGAIYGAQSLGQSGDGPGIQTAALNDFRDNTGDTANLTLTSVSSSYSCGCDNGGAVTAGICTGTGAATCAAGTGHPVVTLTVTATGTFNPLFSYPGVSGSITLSRTSTMRVANVG